MKRYLAGLMLLASPAALAQAPAGNVIPMATATAPAIAFESVPNFFKLPPDMHLGEAAGVAVNSKGHIFIYSRSGNEGPAYAARAAQLLEFGPDGSYIREIGKNLYAWSFAHTVRVDRHDNIWATDKGSDMIIQFNPEGRVIKVFGRKKEASDETAEPWKRPNPPLPPIPQQFRQPTDVAFGPKDEIYFSDGYINSRVAMYDADGVWKGSVGTPGSGPLQFNTPHSITYDAQGNIYVADRGNRRIQVLDGTGKFLREMKIDIAFDYEKTMPAIGAKPDMTGGGVNYGTGLTNAPGAPWAVCITPAAANGTQYLYAADSFPGRLYKMTLDGRVLGVLGEAGKKLGQFGWIHEIACPSENDIYVAEILNWRVQKLILRPTPQQQAAAN